MNRYFKCKAGGYVEMVDEGQDSWSNKYSSLGEFQRSIEHIRDPEDWYKWAQESERFECELTAEEFANVISNS